MPQQSTIYDPATDKVYFVSKGQDPADAIKKGQVLPPKVATPQAQPAPTVNPKKGTSLAAPPGAPQFTVTPAVPAAPIPLRQMATGATELGELAAPFGAAAFPAATPLLPIVEALLGGAHGALTHPNDPTAIGDDALTQGALSMVPEGLGQMAARWGNRAAIAMKGVPNKLPNGGTIVDVLDRIRQDTRGMFPDQDPYGQKAAEAQTRAQNQGWPKGWSSQASTSPGAAGLHLPGQFVGPAPAAPRPDISTVLKQGSGIRFGDNVIPFGKPDRFQASQKAAGEDLAAAENASAAKVPLSTVVSPTNPRLTDLRTRVEQRGGEAATNQDAITDKAQDIAKHMAAKSQAQQDNEPFSSMKDFQSSFEQENADRADQDLEPLTMQQYIDSVIQGQSASVRDVGQFSRAQRGLAGTTARNLFNGKQVSPDQNPDAQTHNAFAMNARDIKHVVAPETKPADARESDLFTATDASKDRTASLPFPSVNVARMRPTFIPAQAIKNVLGSNFSRLGNMTASGAEAAPLLFRLNQLLSFDQGDQKDQ